MSFLGCLTWNPYNYVVKHLHQTEEAESHAQTQQTACISWNSLQFQYSLIFSRTVFTQNFSKSVKFTFLLFGELGRVEEKVDDSQVFPTKPTRFHEVFTYSQSYKEYFFAKIEK